MLPQPVGCLLLFCVSSWSLDLPWRILHALPRISYSTKGSRVSSKWPCDCYCDCDCANIWKVYRITLVNISILFLNFTKQELHWLHKVWDLNYIFFQYLKFVPKHLACWQTSSKHWVQNADLLTVVTDCNFWSCLLRQLKRTKTILFCPASSVLNVRIIAK